MSDYEHRRRVVEEWVLTITDDPMNMKPFKYAFDEAWGAREAHSDAECTVHFVDPDELILRVEYDAPE
ncbi:hypothetical protein NTR1_78 [Nocardia phage NTR1]|nr:hypothetical protein NTR1_78 [Nocardia phage NTR1]